VLAAGETQISDGVTVSRSDSVIKVSFDAALIRTRRADKFEQFVRATLPAIFGPGADSALTSLPVGGIATQGDLLTELPLRGARIPLAGGWTLSVWPETRPGRDGPLVVRYRVAVLQ
jgi:hypothetical protein